MKKRPYVIHIHGHSKSNGCRVLCNLALELEKRGYEVYFHTWFPRDERFKYINDLSKVDRNSAIVIYPEVIAGNPLRFKNVVRMVLYYPGVLGGTKEYYKEEKIFVHDRKFYDKGDILTVPFIDSSLFYKDDTPKTKNCCFVHKGGRWKNIPETDGITEINMNYPENREDLAKLLRETKILYSYDDCSAIMDEALMCGCEVKIVREDGFEDYKPDYAERIMDFEAQIENFIAKTQSMKAKFKEHYAIRFKPILFYNYLRCKYLMKDEYTTLYLYWRLKGLLE